MYQVLVNPQHCLVASKGMSSTFQKKKKKKEDTQLEGLIKTDTDPKIYMETQRTKIQQDNWQKKR